MPNDIEFTQFLNALEADPSSKTPPEIEPRIEAALMAGEGADYDALVAVVERMEPAGRGRPTCCETKSGRKIWVQNGKLCHRFCEQLPDNACGPMP